MSAQDRAIQKLAKELAGIKREVVSWRGPQADYTSIENGGNFTFKDSDGNVTAVVGGQDDGSNTIRHVDGPTPPIPNGLTAHVDGPIVQVSWDGTFETDVTHDWHYLEVLAVGPSNEQLTGTINDLSGGSTSLAATAQGEWFITARSVSRAGKRSLDGDAGTASVQLVGLTGAIDAVQESANGKNTIYYSPTEPTPPELGFNNGDLWFDTSEEGANTASVWDGSAWVSMADARLATIIAAQEALETDLADVQTSVDGKNTITWAPSAPSAVSTPGKAVGDLWYRTSGNSIVGFWKWDGSDWITQLLDKTTIPLIDIGAGTFGNLSGGRMQADSITVDKLLIGSGSSILPWSVTSPAPHIATGGNVLTAVVDPTIGPCIQSTGGTGAGWIDAIRFYRDATTFVNPTSPDSPYVFSATVGYAGVAPTGGWQLRVYMGWYNAAGTYFQGEFGDVFTAVPTGSVNTIRMQANSPAGAYGVRVALQAMGPLGSSRLLVKEARFDKQFGSTLIENGAITTDKLAVGAITAESGIIESLDLGTATVGELDGVRIMGQSIRGEQLSGDAIDGKVITGGTYRTTGGTGSWSDDGLFIAQPDGTSMVRFPTDGSPLSLTASDTQIERASVGDLDLSDGAVRSGGEFTLASGVTAPASPPELTTAWSKFATLAPSSDRDYPPHAWESLGYWADGNAWVRSVNIFGSSSSEPDKVEIFDYATGSFIRSFNVELNPTNNLTIIGDIVYLLGDVYSASGVKSTWIYGYNLNTGARTSRHEYTREIQAKNALGNDGTNLIIASVYNLELWVHKRNPTTGEQVGSDMRSGSNSWPASGGKDLFGVRISGNDVEVVTSWGGRAYLNSNNALARKTDTANASGYAGWVLPAHDVSGCVWVGGVPYPVDSGGSVYQGSSFVSDSTQEVCFVWTNGTYFTTPSPIATIDQGARQEATTSLPVRAGLSKRVYVRSAGSASWARYDIAENVTAARVSGGFQIHSLPTVNSFPAATPATLKSTNNKFVVHGDGSGTWGPLTFNADGTMSSSQVPAWVPVTTFTSGFGAHTFGYAPAYRIWPDGKVEWRGVIGGDFDATVDPFTVPVAARPAQGVNVAIASNQAGSRLRRAEFLSTAAPTMLRVYSAEAAGTWASLDNVSYYLT